ncbi:flavin reductase family protein [Streptomyces sp. NPDC003691]
MRTQPAHQTPQGQPVPQTGPAYPAYPAESGDGDGPEPGVLRYVLGHFCTGIAVITAREEGRPPIGFTCQSFVSLSLRPPLVSFAVSRYSRSWPGIRRAGRFCANVLGADQEALCRRFAAPAGDRFAGVEWWPGPGTGTPRLVGALAWVDCTVQAVYPGGDHRIVVGRIRDVGVTAGEPEPLLFYRARFRRAAPATTPNRSGPTP